MMCTLLFTCKHILDNAYHISWGIWVRKVSNSKSDIQCPSKSLAVVLLEKPHKLRYPNYIPLLYLAPFQRYCQLFTRI